MSAAARIWRALLCGARAARERWRQGDAAPEPPRKRACSFDLPPLELTRSDDGEAEAWYRAHFRQGRGPR